MQTHEIEKPVNGLNMATLRCYRTDTHSSHCLRWLDSSPKRSEIGCLAFHKTDIELAFGSHVNQCQRHTNT